LLKFTGKFVCQAPKPLKSRFINNIRVAF
jgi:hypothetical protein